MFKNSIFTGGFLILSILLFFSTKALKTKEKEYFIVLNTYENYEDARLNRAKLGSLTKAVILEKPEKNIKKTTQLKHTARNVQIRKLIEKLGQAGSFDPRENKGKN